MLKPVFAFFLVISALMAFGQNQSDTVILYVKYPLMVVKNAKDADYIVSITPPDKELNSKLFIVKGYYPDGKLMFMTSSLGRNNLVYDGSYVGFYPNKKRMVVKQYDHGKTIGDIITYYPSGKLYNIKNIDRWGTIHFMQCNDSIGNVIADKGTGRWLVYNDSFQKVQEEGFIDNGVQVGTWKVILKDSLVFEKTFDNGNLVPPKITAKKESADSTYTIVDTNSEYPGGLKALYEFIGKILRYPESAVADNVQGRVIIQFIVERDGSLHEFKLVKGLGYGCEEGAIAAVQASSPWKPALKNGNPVRVAYTLPITFTLSE